MKNSKMSTRPSVMTLMLLSVSVGGCSLMTPDAPMAPQETMTCPVRPALSVEKIDGMYCLSRTHMAELMVYETALRHASGCK